MQISFQIDCDHSKSRNLNTVDWHLSLKSRRSTFLTQIINCWNCIGHFCRSPSLLLDFKLQHFPVRQLADRTNPATCRTGLDQQLLKNSQASDQNNKCNKYFSQNIDLKTPSLIHTGAKSQKCTHCNCSANQGASLKKHILKQTGEMARHCEKCDHTSTSKQPQII